MVAAGRGYGSRTWFTSRQAREAGHPLRWNEAEGRHATVLRPAFRKDRENPTDLVLVGFNAYRVYNGDLCDGWQDPAREVREIPEPDAAAQAIVDVWGGTRHQGDRAFYAPSQDSVTVPPRDAFHSLADYVGTVAHEKSHQSGHRTRLARPGITNHGAFGDHLYAAEELVAESSAAFILGRLGLSCETLRSNNAAYLRSWLKRFASDPKVLIHAMGQGMKAAEYTLKAAGL